MKIYTRQGDDGTTGLLGGSRLSKSDPRFECTGSIDELNAALGLAAVAIERRIADLVKQIQNELFVIGAHLGSPDPKASNLPRLDESIILRLEKEIDAAETELPPLKNFILPGGSEGAAQLHVARTICRRAERALVAFSAANPVSPVMVKYINRLSDWLFVYARLANRRAGKDDVIWTVD